MEIHAPATPENQRALDREIERRFGQFGGVERRGATPVSDLPAEIEIRTARDGSNQLVVKGYASVFNRLSLDIPLPTGETFRERIAPGAFDLALAKPTTQYLLLDHDRGAILGSTDAHDAESLELRVDPNGLRFYSKVVDTSYARDLRALMEAGIIKQASFGFTVAEDSWSERDGVIYREITEVDELLEITITARGAYPQTVATVVGARALEFAREEGRLTGLASSNEVFGPQGDGPGTGNREPSEREAPSVAEAVPSEAVSAPSVGSRSQHDRISEMRARLEQHRIDFQKGKKP